MIDREFPFMRMASAGLFQSVDGVDGVAESPNLWQVDSFDAGVGATMDRSLMPVDTVLLGRTSYQEWSGYWPTAGQDDEFAAFIDPVRIFIASRTLTSELDWQNAQVIPGDLVAFVRNLKASEGGNISVCGDISVVRQLLFAGLLDSLTLVDHPVVGGVGQHLFEPGDPTTRLQVVDATTTGKGNAIVTYALRPE